MRILFLVLFLVPGIGVLTSSAHAQYLRSSTGEMIPDPNYFIVTEPTIEVTEMKEFENSAELNAAANAFKALDSSNEISDPISTLDPMLSEHG